MLTPFKFCLRSLCSCLNCVFSWLTRSKGTGLQYRARRPDPSIRQTMQDSSPEQAHQEQQRVLYNSMGITPIAKISKCSGEQLLNSACNSAATSQSTSPILTVGDAQCIINMDPKSLPVELRCKGNGGVSPSVIMEIPEVTTREQENPQEPSVSYWTSEKESWDSFTVSINILAYYALTIIYTIKQKDDGRSQGPASAWV